jgi:hypothetical protein
VNLGSEVLGMHRRFVAVAAVAPATVALVVLAGIAVLPLPARAGTPGLVVKVTPSQGLRPGQTVDVSGHGLPKSSGGSPVTWFITECTAAVRGRMNPATDTPHCDIAHAQAIRVGSNGTFNSHYRLTTGIIGDGYCGTGGHATCVIGVGNAQGMGTVVRITFRMPPIPTTTTSTTTSTRGEG